MKAEVPSNADGRKAKRRMADGALAWPFLRLYGLTLLYFSANAILNVVIPLRGESLGASNAAIGLVMGAYLFTTMLFRPWAGRVIERYGAVRVLRAVLILHGVSLILYTVTGLEGYLAARALQGVCTAFFSMALQLGVIDALPDGDRAQGISLYALCASLPSVIGPMLALAVWEAGDAGAFGWTMAGLAVLTAAAGFGATLRHEPAAGKTPPAAEREPAAMKRAFSRFIRHPEAVRCSAIMLGASVVFGAVTVFVPLYAAQVSGGHAGLFLALQGGTLVLARFALRKRVPSDGKWHPAFAAGLVFALAAAALLIGCSAVAGAVPFYAGAVLIGFAQALLYPALTTYLSFALPAADRGVFLGLFIATADLGVSLGGFVMGPVADATSYAFMYMLCAALSLALLLPAQLKIRA